MRSIEDRITQARQKLGDKLCILAHHYQDDRIIRHADRRGDSLELARMISGLEAEHIVFCGVRFMAESAAILTKPGQKVYLPAKDAECVMARTAPAALVADILKRLRSKGRKIIPLTYVNSSLEIKALCGSNGGAACTSANAQTMLRWALSQGDAVLFLPDKNLGQNTALSLGIPPGEQSILDIRAHGQQVDLEKTMAARMLLWPGCCPIHAHFSLKQIKKTREEHPDIRVIVHPESDPEVVRAADAAGSTSFIIRYVGEAPTNAEIAIGTEINLVKRLADQYRPAKTIIPLSESLCNNMAKINSSGLADLLENLCARPENTPAVTVSQQTATEARLALERMLQACA